MSDYWVDAPRVEIPPASAWSGMTFTQLLEVKTQLLDKIYMARGKPAYLQPLNKALAQLEVLLSQKMSDPRGGA